MSNTIRKMYDNDNADISVGVMIDMKVKTETFIIGSSVDLILWAESGFPERQTGSLIRHTNEIGSIIKNINKLIRFSRETDSFLDDYERASNIEVYCAENYSVVLESIANNYEYGNHVNMFLNLIVMNTYGRCICERRKYNDPKNLLKGRGFLLKEAEKRISQFKADTEKHIALLSELRRKKYFDYFTAINNNTDSLYNSSVLKAVGADSDRKTMYLCGMNNQNGLFTFLEMYADILITYGFSVSRCAVCDNLMVIKSSSSAYTCNRAECRKKYHNKVNSNCRKKLLQNPIEKTYLSFTGACRTYRKKLLRSDEALALYDKKYGEVRAVVLETKNSLPKTVKSEDIQMFSNYCERERDMLKEFSDELRGRIKKQDD